MTNSTQSGRGALEALSGVRFGSAICLGGGIRTGSELRCTPTRNDRDRESTHGAVVRLRECHDRVDGKDAVLLWQQLDCTADRHALCWFAQTESVSPFDNLQPVAGLEGD